MEETVQQRQATDQSSDENREDSGVERAGRAVAQLLANPRRTRRS